MAVVLRVLAGKLGPYLLAGVLVVLAGTAGALGFTRHRLSVVTTERDDANVKMGALGRDLGRCRATKGLLQAAIDATNEQVRQDAERAAQVEKARSEERAAIVAKGVALSRQNAALAVRLREGSKSGASVVTDEVWSKL